MPGCLSVRHSLGTSDRVVQLCFHPVQPWLVYVDKTSAVHVLNWVSQEVVFSAQFGGLDEAAVHYQTLQKMAEQDTAFWGHKASQDLEVSRTVSGKVRMVKFFDVETSFWQQVSQLSTIKGKAEEYPGSSVAGGDVLMGQRWLLVVCDNKLVLHEMLSHNSREISKVALEGKSPTTVATLTGPHGSSLRYEPILALGCSDGAIRLVSFSTLRVIGKLGQKSGSISCLMTLHLTSSVTRLVSGASDGSLSIWDPFPSGGGQSGSNSIPPSVVIKAHEGDIMGLELSHGPHEGAMSRIITIGADRTVAAWEVGAFKEVLRFKQPSQRLPCHSICYCPALITSPDSFPLLMATSANKIWGATVSNGAIKSLAETGALLGSTGKSAGKIYAMAVHPLQTHLIAIGVGSGLAVLTASIYSHPCMVMLPGEKDKNSPGHEIAVLAPSTTSVHQREYMAVQKDGSGEHPKQGRSPELLQDNMVISSADLELTGHCVVIPHLSGLKIVVLWPAANKYKIFRRIGPTDWERCYEGDAKQVVWHSNTSVMAVLDVPDPIPIPTATERRMRGRPKPDQAAMDALAAAAVPDPSIKIIRVPAAGSIQPEGQLNFSGSPTQLFPGPILGVTSSSAHGEYTVEPQFQFYDWKTLQSCSPNMPAPQWINWSPEGDVCAMAYPSHILICEVLGDFVPVTSVPISQSTSGVWENRELYVATPSSIECVVAPRTASTNEGKPELMVQVITLASFRAGPKWLTGAVDDSEALPQPRPWGQLSVLGARGDNLWLVDTLGHPVLVSLAIPGFSSLRLVSDKNYGAARSAAVGKVPADNLASLLVRMGTKSAVEALKLPSLTLEVRLRVAIKARYLKHALVCLEALALGCDRPEAVIRLPEFRDTLKDQNAKDDIGESKFVTYNALDITGSPFMASSSPAEVQDDGAGGIDWNTPLKESTKPRAIDHDRVLMLSESVAELGIELIDAATEARLINTAMKAAKLLLNHLPPETASELLLRVQTRLAERSKKKDLEEITELTERAKMTTSGRFVGLAAAALSGNYLLMTSVLKDLKMMSA